MILILLPLLLYLSSARFGFVLDDKIVIEENQFVQQGLDGIAAILRTDGLAGFINEQSSVVAGSRYRPLSLVSFAIEYELYGLNPARSHLINVALYAITCLALFWMLAIFVNEEGATSRFFDLPFVATLLFALHPLHSEVVANIKGRDEILALLFSLLTLLLIFQHLRSRGRAALALAGVSFLLALLAKENAITFLAVIPLTMLVLSDAKARAVATALAPVAAATALYLLLRHQAVGLPSLSGGEEVTELMNNPFVEASRSEKYGTIFLTWGMYLKLLIFPHPLTHDYYPYHVSLVPLSDWRAIASLTIYAGMTAAAIATLRRGNIAAWSILFFVATFSVVSNLFFPIGTFMNERFMYMPSIGFCSLVAWILTRLMPVALGAKPSAAKAVPIGVAAALALGFGAKTLARIPDWQSDMTLNRSGVAVSTGSARINCFMGYSLYETSIEEPDPARKRGILDEADSYIERSLAIYPTYRDALNVRAGILSSRFLLDDRIDALLDGFFEILTRNKPPHVDEFLTWLNEQDRHREELANFYWKLGYEYFFRQMGDDAEAERYLAFGYRVAPTNPAILEALGIFWLAHEAEPGSLAARRDAYQALKFAEEGIRIDPERAKLHEIAAEARARLGDANGSGGMR